MSPNHGDNREETGESSTHLNDEENSEERPITQSPRKKSQRTIVPTEKARKICDFCQKVFERSNRTRDHEVHIQKCKKYHKYVTGENSNQCSLCPKEKEFASQGSVLIHLEKAHFAEKECEICDTTLLKKHWTIHWKTCQKYRGLINFKELQCVPCKKNYVSRRSLLAHAGKLHKDLLNKDGNVAKPTAKRPKKSSETPQLPKMECPNCKALFDDEDELIEHVETCSTGTHEPEEDPLMSAPSTKLCSFGCEELVPKKNLGEHYERCSKAADLIKGIKCTKCPQKQFKSKHEVFGHVLKTHLAMAQEEVISQYAFDEETMDTGLEAEIPRNGTGSQGIEPESTDIKIVETFGNSNPNGAGTSLVGKKYFTDVDPCVITRLYICPLCKGKLGFKAHVQNHVLVHHKINAIAWKFLKLDFETVEV